MQEYHKDHVARIERECNRYEQQQMIVEKECKEVNDILSQYEVSHVDMCSIDTEGSELVILESIDFARFSFDVFVVENPYGSQKMKAFFDKMGYVHMRRLECDDVYVTKGYFDASR